MSDNQEEQRRDTLQTVKELTTSTDLEKSAGTERRGKEPAKMELLNWTKTLCPRRRGSGSVRPSSMNFFI
ncbi:hypothetical protein GDO86_019317 [Hymenochirus boettgeri]|uniref:Uncharacterized protein n=1 Tax=Hymenochirus boettgeri TaxID=247094 RepID=A0A8T2IKV1_9PIPI|nr:hypothetical protein GDO86_019317 [Hymenochirus boettgeri]